MIYCLLLVVYTCLVLLNTCSQDKKREYYTVAKHVILSLLRWTLNDSVQQTIITIHTASQPKTFSTYINLLNSDTR